MSKGTYRMLLVFAVLALFVMPVAAIAAAGFTDVDDASVFKADIQWLADAGVTKGCNPPANDEFCPQNYVTREQMAAFMHRLAANKVVDAKTAVTAGDADTLDGKHAGDLETSAYMVFKDSGFISVPANTTKTIAELSLPAGTYVIFARATINSNMSAASRSIECSLSAGSDTLSLTNLFLDANLEPGESEEASWMIGHTFDSPGSATLWCTSDASWNGNILDPVITAISVQNLTVTPLTGSAGGGGSANG